MFDGELTRNLICDCEHGILYHEIRMWFGGYEVKECYYGCSCKEFSQQSMSN